MPKASAKTADTSDAFVMPQKEVPVEHYEMLALMPGASTEQDVDVTIADITAFLTAQGATITLTQNLGRKSLGYTVMGSRNGTYVVYEFDAVTSAIAAMNEKLRIRKDLARFLIVRKTIKSAAEMKEEARVKGIIEGRRAIKTASDDVKLKAAEAAAPKKPARKPRAATTEAPVQNIEQEIDKLLTDDVKL